MNRPATASQSLGNPAQKLVDPGRIELPPLQCECSVLPLNYGPVGPQVFIRGAVRMFPIFLTSNASLENRNPEETRYMRDGVMPFYYEPIGPIVLEKYHVLANISIRKGNVLVF